MQNIDWVELGYKFMRTNGDIPPTVFMFGNWTEYNFNIISDWTLFQYQYHLKRKFQHDLTTACYFFHTYMHIPHNEGSNQNKKVRAHNTIPGTHFSFTPILSHSHPFCALQILKVYSLNFIDVQYTCMICVFVHLAHMHMSLYTYIWLYLTQLSEMTHENR